MARTYVVATIVQLPIFATKRKKGAMKEQKPKPKKVVRKVKKSGVGKTKAKDNKH